MPGWPGSPNDYRSTSAAVAVLYLSLLLSLPRLLRRMLR